MLSHGVGLISSVTDAVMSGVAAWRSRPLEAMYPVVFLDALWVKLREDALLLNANQKIKGLGVLAPPLELSALQGAVYWHERTNGDPRHRWFRRLVAAVARTTIA
ncbi:hypothetical protein BH11PSE7_BH11PSE7_30120 [soil metagenome]